VPVPRNQRCPLVVIASDLFSKVPSGLTGRWGSEAICVSQRRLPRACGPRNDYVCRQGCHGHRVSAPRSQRVALNLKSQISQMGRDIARPLRIRVKHGLTSTHTMTFLQTGCACSASFELGELGRAATLRCNEKYPENLFGLTIPRPKGILKRELSGVKIWRILQNCFVRVAVKTSNIS
jgi:hypothetical protein